MDRSSSVLVVGASNYDINGKIEGPVIPGDSNPSRVYGACGGVGRNVAENLARLGVSTSFITAFGDDALASVLRKSCTDMHIDISRSITLSGTGSDSYLSVLDGDGNLVIGAADIGALESLGSEQLEGLEEYISEFPIVFADTNSAELLRFTACSTQGALFADAVSVKKAPRLLPVIEMIDTLKVNLAELAVLTGMQTETREQIRAAASELMGKGLHRLFVTMGAEGCGCMNAFGWNEIPAIPVEVESVSGAGDAFAAAMTWASLMGCSDRDTLSLAAAAAAVTIESESAVSSSFTRESVLRMKSREIDQ